MRREGFLEVSNLLETLIEQVASGWIAGIMLDYGVPVVLGLSLNWVQGRVTVVLEALLDHDLLNTTQTLNDLKGEMTRARDFVDLSDRISQAVGRLLRTEHAVVYGECDGSLHMVGGRSVPAAAMAAPVATIPAHDPAVRQMRTALAPVELNAMNSVLRGGLLLPLVVLGRVVGALHCGTRAYDRCYDRAERAVLENFARDLAIAFVCLVPRSNFRNLPILDDGGADTTPGRASALLGTAGSSYKPPYSTP